MARFKPPLCGFSCAEISGKEAFAPMNDTFMKTKPVFPLLVSMALPNVISMLVNSLYNIVDSLFVAQISEQAMTALSLVFPIQNFVNAVAIGFGIGINAQIALYLGAGDHENANRAATHGMMFSLLHGVLGSFMLLGVGQTGGKMLAHIGMLLLFLHLCIGVRLTMQTLRTKQGFAYSKQNALFWTRRASGLAILILVFFHMGAFGSVED